MDTSRHVGHRVLISGAGSGIGRAAVLRFLSEGASVVGIDRSESALAQLAVDADAGSRLAVRTVDVCSQGDITDLVDSQAAFDVLVNNAGIMDHFLPVGEVDDAVWDAVIDVNLTGVMRLTRAVLPAMLEQGSGSVVTVASKGALSAGASGVAYAAAKHGVLGIVKHVAWFYGPQGIRSNAVCPGAVATAIGSSAAPRSDWAMQRAQLAMATIGGIAQPDQIASVISWLACAEASDVNGAIVTADGGWDAA